MLRNIIFLFTFILSVSSVAWAETQITVLSDIPFKKGSNILDAIKKECSLGAKLSDFIKESAAEKGIKVNQGGKLGGGNQLIVNILSASAKKSVERGGWGSLSSALSGGGTSYVSIEGTYIKNGKKVGTFRGQRSSGGGFAGGFKGNCSLLGRCIKALGDDVATWLQDPEMDSRIGE